MAAWRIIRFGTIAKEFRDVWFEVVTQKECGKWQNSARNVPTAKKK